MRKLYFAMVPKRSFLKDAAVAAGLGTALVYGAKRVLGDEKYHAVKASFRTKASEAASSQETERSAAWGEEAARPERDATQTTGDGALDRVCGALRVTKAAAKLLLVANTKLLNILSKEDTEG